jgi:hypothetical protein
MTNIRHDYPDIPLAPPRPVMQEQCWMCAGTGWRETRIDDFGNGHGFRCTYCGGTGYLWVEKTDV